MILTEEATAASRRAIDLSAVHATASAIPVPAYIGDFSREEIETGLRELADAFWQREFGPAPTAGLEEGIIRLKRAEVPPLGSKTASRTLVNVGVIPADEVDELRSMLDHGVNYIEASGIAGSRLRTLLMRVELTANDVVVAPRNQLREIARWYPEAAMRPILIGIGTRGLYQTVTVRNLPVMIAAALQTPDRMLRLRDFKDVDGEITIQMYL